MREHDSKEIREALGLGHRPLTTEQAWNAMSCLMAQLKRAERSIKSLRATVTMERRRSALQLSLIEDGYADAKRAGLTAKDPGLYWLALNRYKARRVDCTADRGTLALPDLANQQLGATR